MTEITRRQLKMMKRAEGAKNAKQVKNVSKFFLFAAAVVLIGGLFGITTLISKNSQDKQKALGIESFPEQGRKHIAESEPKPTYNSNPPTSGDHWANWAPVKIYTAEVPDQNLVHNLEHGHIWVSYNCALLKKSSWVDKAYAAEDAKDAGCSDLAGKLEALATRLNSKIILTPRAANDRLISVAGWTKLMSLDQFDEQKIEEFYKLYKDKSPEFFPDSAKDTISGKL